jgi:hypothetical protein
LRYPFNKKKRDGGGKIDSRNRPPLTTAKETPPLNKRFIVSTKMGMKKAA